MVIIDYGAGNLRSVANAIVALGYQPKVSLEEGIRRTSEWYRAENLI